MSPTATTPQQTPTSSAPTSHVDERYLAKSLEAVEARTETKFAQLLGEIRVIGERLAAIDGKVSPLEGRLTEVENSGRAGRREIIIAIVASAFAVATLGWAGVQIFQSGIGLSAGAFQSGMTAAQSERADDQPEPGN